MDDYMTTSYCAWGKRIRRNGSLIECESLVEDIEKLQAVAEAAEEYVKLNGEVLRDVPLIREIPLNRSFAWSDLLRRHAELKSALANIKPKTVQQLQDERNSAADSMLEAIDYCHDQDVLLNHVAAYRETCQAHEAALAKQTGE